MKIKLLIFCMVAVFAVAGPPQVGAEIIHLDGIANAGWYADDSNQSPSVYCLSLTTAGTYYYQWIYSIATPAPCGIQGNT